MSIGQEMPIQGPPFAPMPRHYGQRYFQHPTKQQQQSYMVSVPLQPPHYWFPYDQSHPPNGALFRPLYQAPTAYHTPPMQQAPFHYVQPQQGPYFYAAPPPPLPSLALQQQSLHPAVSACKDTAEYKSVAEAYMDDPSSAPLRHLKLIPASASVIPPHPSVEESAVPFAGIGADLVWEVVHEALARGAPRSGTATPSGCFGTIGGERKQAQTGPALASLEQYSLSGASSKALVGPLTPPSSTGSTACPIPTHFQSDKFVQHELPPWHDAYWEVTRSPETSPTVAGRGAERPDPYTAFANFCDNLLNVTLVTPQTLLLALHYVCQACKTSAPSIFRTFSAKSAPYKLMIGALVMANKVLDDNSYKSQTWSQVSAVPLREVNAGEAFVLDALAFDVSMSTREWADFVYSLAVAYQHTRLVDASALRRLGHLATFKMP